MRPSLLVSLLLMFLLLHAVQGIRLDKGFMQSGNRNIHEDKGLWVQRSTGGVGEVILCKEGQCKGVGRLLISATTSTSAASTTSKNDENGGINAKPSKKCPSTNEELTVEHKTPTCNSSRVSKNQEVTHDHYMDVMELTAMDYSPARRKPPIHN